MEEETGSFISTVEIETVLWQNYVKRGESALLVDNAAEAVMMFAVALKKAQCFGEDDWRTVETQRQLDFSLKKLHGS